MLAKAKALLLGASWRSSLGGYGVAIVIAFKDVDVAAMTWGQRGWRAAAAAAAIYFGRILKDAAVSGTDKP